jgi:NodT family efflux transporter outer membrane factor (OMF) lipoprotein
MRRFLTWSAGRAILEDLSARLAPLVPWVGERVGMLNHSTARRLTQRGTLVLLFGLAAAAALAQTGCSAVSEWAHNGFKVGPNYVPPPSPVLRQWIDTNDPKVRVGEPNLWAWWDVFDDPILTVLLHDTYANNLTIRAAGLQIIQAELARSIARSELLPQAQNAIMGYNRSMASGTGGSPGGAGPSFGTALSPGTVLSPVTVPSTPITGATPTGNGTTTSASNYGATGGASPGGGGSAVKRFASNFSTNLNASWELDFWGLFRRNLEASNASLDQSVKNYDEMLVLLLSNVANQYVEIRTLQRRLELARSNVALQEPLVAAYQTRYKAGMENAYPGYYQLLSNLENTKALIPELEISLRQANNQLCILLGQPVHDLLPELGDGTVPDPADPKKRMVRIPRPRDPSVVVGIPGDFLLRRPDVQAAEDQLKVQSAQIGIAVAEMLPHIGINGSIGLASNNFQTLFEGRSFTGTFGPTLTWNILNYGRLLANVRFQNVQFRQFVTTYQQAVLNANQDAENSLIAYLRTLDQAGHLQISADAAASLTNYLIRQYEGGFLPPGAADTSAFITQLFTAVNFRVTQQDAAAQAEGNIALNLILVYRSMGGGWQIRLQDGNDFYARARADACCPLVPPPNVPTGGWPAGTTAPSPENPAQPDALAPTETTPKVGPRDLTVRVP